MAKSPTDGDVAFIKALAELLRENDLTELEVKRDYGEDNSLNVRVSRATQTVVTQAVAPAPVAAAPAIALKAPAAAAAPRLAVRWPPICAVTSPMVGTAYLQAEPGAPSFIEVCKQVSEGHA